MNLELITNALGEANIQLRNLEVATEGLSLRTVDAKMLDDYLSLMVRIATKMHDKCQDAILKDAMRVVMNAGYEVKAPQ